MIVTPGPDLLAGRHVAVAAGSLACGGMRCGHETLRAGMQNLVCNPTWVPQMGLVSETRNTGPTWGNVSAHGEAACI